MVSAPLHKLESRCNHGCRHEDMKHMRTILVTGGAGFIGANFVHHLLRRYDDVRVVVLDKLTYAGNPENPADFADDPRLLFVEGDIAHTPTVEALVAQEQFWAILNFAAESHVDR